MIFDHDETVCNFLFLTLDYEKPIITGYHYRKIEGLEELELLNIKGIFTPCKEFKNPYLRHLSWFLQNCKNFIGNKEEIPWLAYGEFVEDGVVKFEDDCDYNYYDKVKLWIETNFNGFEDGSKNCSTILETIPFDL